MDALSSSRAHHILQLWRQVCGVYQVPVGELDDVVDDIVFIRRKRT